jgi:hypothetical protein
VAYSPKTRTVESQQPTITRQRPVNNRGMVLSVQSVPTSAHATIEYIMPSLSNNCTSTVFSTRSVLRYCKQGQLAAAELEDRCGSVTVSCCC